MLLDSDHACTSQADTEGKYVLSVANCGDCRAVVARRDNGKEREREREERERESVCVLVSHQSSMSAPLPLPTASGLTRRGHLQQNSIASC